MKKKFIVVILVLLVSLSLLSCDQGQTSLSDTSIGSAVKSFIKGDVTGELNKTYSTQWFDFTIKSIKTTNEYGDYTPEDGYKLVVAKVVETNTFGEPLPMGAYDFTIEADGLAEDDRYPFDAFDAKMMPWEYELGVDETTEYDVVFAIPEEINDIRFVYIEIDEDDHIGATFTIKHSF